MNKNLLVAAIGAALAAPASAVANIAHWRNPVLGEGTRQRARSQRQRRNPQRLQMRGWPEIPCEAPEAYFWKQNERSNEWRLYALPPLPGTRTYDEVFDRTITVSGWGYVKPTYSHGR